MSRIKPPTIVMLGLLFGALVLVSCNRQPEDSYPAKPVLVDEIVAVESGDTLRPIRMELKGGELYVAYRQREHIDVYDFLTDARRRIALNAPVKIQPADFTVQDSSLVVAQLGHGLMLYGLDGVYRESWDTLPDSNTALAPIQLEEYGGVFYVADIGQSKVLAISAVDAQGLTEFGELILTIPPESFKEQLHPSAVHITSDGRLLIGDAESGLVRAFTCDGRHIYDFETAASEGAWTPQGFAEDDLPDPSMQDPNSLDPSGIREMGRIHLVDSQGGRVLMFNPLGRYLGAYSMPAESSSPTDIAIDRAQGRIYVADPGSARIWVYSYKGA